jgi:hypothetical protein
MSDEIVRFYDAGKNPEGYYLPGVPLDDIPESRWETLPEWLQIAADASGWYTKTAPKRASAPSDKE